MTVFLASFALGIVLAWRSRLMGVIAGTWALAIALLVAALVGAISVADLLPAFGFAVLGYNAGLVLGYGVNHLANLRSA